jgi:cobalt-precorrin 5A hydrolase
MGGAAAMVIAGLGFRQSCPPEELVALVRAAEQQAGCSADALAVAAFKAAAPAARAAAARLGLALLVADSAAMEAAQPRCPTRSDAALRATGFASVAEAAALAVAGPGGRLRLPRIASPQASCALAESGS